MTETVVCPPPAHAPAMLSVSFAGREVQCRRVDEVCLGGVEHPKLGRSHGFAIIAMLVDRVSANDRALYVGLSADQARDYACQLLRIADTIDASAGKH